MTHPTGFSRGAYMIAPNDVISIDNEAQFGGPSITTIRAHLRPNSFVKGPDMPGILADYARGGYITPPTTVSFNLALTDARLVRRAMLALDAKKDLAEGERDALWVVMSKLTQAIREKTK